MVEAKRKQGTGVRTTNTKSPKSMADVQFAATVAIADSPIREQETPVASVPIQWKTVGPKRKSRKPKAPSEKKVRPDGLIIKSGGEVTYAQILQRVKVEEKLKGLGDAVTRIRRTQQGELLLQLNQSGQDTSAFKALSGDTLEEAAEVRSLSHRVTIECKDLDEITSKEDIQNALHSQLELSDVVLDDINLRKGYGGTQSASIRLAAESARKALSAGLLKVGWVGCRLRERVTVTNGQHEVHTAEP